MTHLPPDPVTTPEIGRGRRSGIVLGIVAFAAIYLLPAPAELSAQGWTVAGVALLMAIWWLTEAVPIAATALLPLALFPVLGVSDIADAASPYANPLIFLFLGGFMLALAMERWNLHKRLALHILTLAGTQYDRLVGGFMVAAAGLSMWVSNTATAVIMLPIALSVVRLLPEKGTADTTRFPVALLLAIAYACSIGGLATLIGTPPNALLAAFLFETYGISVGFAEWMVLGLPLSLVMLGATWLILVKGLFHLSSAPIPGLSGSLAEGIATLGPMSRGEKNVALIFATTAALWILRPLIDEALPGLGLTDPGIAILAAIALFAIPSGESERRSLLDWRTAKRLPWEVLILFGGGLSLAAAISGSGLAGYIGILLETVGTWPVFVIVLTVSAVIIFLTELTSNTATTAAFLPVVAAVADAIGQPAATLAVPAALAASCAFMMPVATPPNAIIFASGRLTVGQMAHAGFWLNLVGIAVVGLAGYLFAPLLFG